MMCMVHDSRRPGSQFAIVVVIAIIDPFDQSTHGVSYHSLSWEWIVNVERWPSTKFAFMTEQRRLRTHIVTAVYRTNRCWRIGVNCGGLSGRCMKNTDPKSMKRYKGYAWSSIKKDTIKALPVGKSARDIGRYRELSLCCVGGIIERLFTMVKMKFHKMVSVIFLESFGQHPSRWGPNRICWCDCSSREITIRFNIREARRLSGQHHMID